MAEDRSARPGPLALVGGGEWRSGAVFDIELLEHGDGEVLVLPTAAAYERPERSVEMATAWFGALGAKVRPCMVLGRADAGDPSYAEMVRSARFIYLSGSSPLHLRSVLKDSTVLGALVAAWHGGAAIAGTSAGAVVLTDPMVDPRGGAFTVGLGLVRGLAVVAHHGGELTAQLRRTLSLAPAGCALVAVPETTAVLREPDGTWRSAGVGEPTVFVASQIDDLTALAGKPIG